MNGRRRSGHHPPRDAGIATVWAATGVAVLMTILVVALHLAAAVHARHRAEAAADLAALAAAGVAVQGTEPACARAAEIATAMGAAVTTCDLAGWDALVEVGVPVPLALPGLDTATGRARAGPVPPVPEEMPPDAPVGARGSGHDQPSAAVVDQGSRAAVSLPERCESRPHRSRDRSHAPLPRRHALVIARNVVTTTDLSLSHHSRRSRPGRS